MSAVSDHPAADVVITGMGWAAPPGITPDETLDACLRGRTAIRRIDRLPGLSGTKPIHGATVPPFEIISRMRYPKSAKFMTRAVECAFSAACDAVTASGLDWRAIDGERIALFTASGQTGLEYDTFFKALAVAWEGDRSRDFRFLGSREAHMIDRYFSLRTLANGGLALLSMELGARGGASNHVHSDTGFALVLRAAQADLQEHRCDVAVVGGYDCLLTAATYLGYSEAGLLARGGAGLLPFDRHGSGIVLGEGAAFFVLERKADARPRGAAMAEIIGVGAIHDHCSTGAHRWCAGDLRTLIAETGICGAACDCIVAHGIGIPESDAGEAVAWTDILSGAVPVTAFKGLTGYLGAATEAVELALTVLCLRAGMVPAVAGLEYPANDVGRAIVMGEPQPLSSPRPAAILVSRSWAGSIAAIAIRTENIPDAGPVQQGYPPNFS